VETVHARQAAADAGQGRGRDEKDGRGLRGDQGGAGQDVEAEEGVGRAERDSAAAEERHVHADAGGAGHHLRPRGEDTTARQPEGRHGRHRQRAGRTPRRCRERLRRTSRETSQERGRVRRSETRHREPGTEPAEGGAGEADQGQPDQDAQRGDGAPGRGTGQTGQGQEGSGRDDQEDAGGPCCRGGQSQPSQQSQAEAGADDR